MHALVLELNCDSTPESKITHFPLIFHPPTAGEDVHMRAVLSNPEVQGALMDKDVQAVILALKSNPDKAHRYLGFFPV